MQGFSSPTNNILVKSLTDIKNQLPDEQWELIKRSLIEFVSLKESEGLMKEVFVRSFIYKKHTGLKFIIKENLESELKNEIKNYYSSLSFDSLESLAESILELPLAFNYKLFVFIIYVCKPDLIKTFEPSKEFLEDYYRDCLKKKKSIIYQISQASSGNGSYFEITSFDELIELEFFAKNEELEVATLEYVMRMLNNESSEIKIEEKFGTEFLKRLRKKILIKPNYITFTTDLKKGIALPYFTQEGFQSEERTPNYSDLAKDKYSFSDLIPPEFPWRIENLNTGEDIEKEPVEEEEQQEETQEAESNDEISGILSDEPEIKVV